VAGGNVVEITVTAVNDSKEGFDSVKAGADEAAGSLDEEAAAADRAAEASDRLAVSQGAAADSAKAQSDATEDSAAKTDLAATAGEKGGKVLRDLALGAGLVAAGSIYMGVKFQEGATQLVTGAGQSAKGLKQVEDGMLAVSTQTATSSKDVESGMYMIESAGFHGAQGLKVLQAAAEGAKVGNASLGDMANVVTSALNAYHEPASKAVSVTNQLVATVASGKMHMQDLATSLSNVLPIAASAHISLAQVGGAMATMTSQGMTARRASMNLANMIRALVSPSAASSAEMKNLGLNANDVAKNVGKVGLTGTLDTLTEAILKSSKGGSALAATFNGMAPATKGYAREILAGKVSTNDLSNAMKGMNPVQAALLTNFEKTATSATGVKTTFDGAMKTMVGGATGLNVALLLGGKHMSTFKGNVDSVADAAKHGGSSVEHWGDITKDTSFKLDQAKVSVENLGTSVGLALLPALTKILGPVDSFVSWIARSKVAVDILAGVLVGALAGFAVIKTVEGFQLLGKAFSAAQGMAKGLAEKLGILGAAQDEEAVSAEGAADAEEGLDAAMDANPIMLVVAAIALIVVAFVELWKHCAAFRDFWKDIWDGIKDAFDVVWRFIKSHWEMILAILLGPVAVAALEIREHWKQISRLAADLWHDVTRFFKNMWRDVKDTTKELWDWLKGFVDREVEGVKVILSWFDHLGRLFREWWDDAVNAVHDVIYNHLVPFIKDLPHRILTALGDLGHLLWDAGKDVVNGLINGIKSAVGGLLNTVKGLAGDVTGAFKSVLGIFSPSRVFAQHGKDIVAGLVQGINGSSPLASAAMRKLGGGLSLGGVNAGGIGGGGVIQLQVTGSGSGLNALFIEWLKQEVRIRGGGGPSSVQRALGQTA
jgi:hypothetical protein